MKNIIITGVSSGIGYATAALLLERGYAVFGSVRKQEDVDRVSAALGEGFTPLLFDVTDEAAVHAAAEVVTEAVGDQGLAGLVNNAGISLPGPLAALPTDTVRTHLEVNVMGVIHVTQAFLPLLGMRAPCPHPPGRIVNISSTSGRFALPFTGPYSASKYALEAISDAWRRELVLFGIDLIVLEPGPTETVIWDKSSFISERFADTPWGPYLKKIDTLAAKRRAMKPEVIARAVLRALEARWPRTRYAFPIDWIRFWWAPRFLPDRIFDFFVQRELGMWRKSRD